MKAFYLAKTCADLPFQVVMMMMGIIVMVVMMIMMVTLMMMVMMVVTMMVIIFPCQIIFPLIYVLIVYFMTAQPLDPARSPSPSIAVTTVLT